MRIIVTIIFLGLSLSLFGQTYKQYTKAGDKALESKDYYSAMRYFQDALEIKSEEGDVHYKAGEAARLFAAYESASYHYEKAETYTKGAYPLMKLRLAEVKQTLGDYAEAETLLTDFIKDTDNELFKRKAETMKKACTWAKQQARGEDVRIKQFDKKVNTKYSEFAGVYLGDSLIFSSLKFKDESVEEDRRRSKVIYTLDPPNERPKSLRMKGTPENLNIGNASFSKDGKLMFFTVCEYVNTLDTRCEIYRGEWDGRRWLTEALEEPINLSGFTSTQPFYSEVEGFKGLYFSSDRPEGKGGMDIWFAPKAGADFGEPRNLAINTEADDITPSLDAKKSKLYFSSTGYENSFGGYDIYQVDLSEIRSSGVENVGKPANSSYNDVYYWRSGNTALVSSNRVASASMLKDEPACCNDLYELTFPEEPEEEPIVMVEPKPVPKPEPKPEPKPVPKPEPKPVPKPVPQPKPEPKPVVTTTIESLLPVRVYFDNDEPEKRTMATTTPRSYGETYQAYLSRENTFFSKAGGLNDANWQRRSEMEAFFYGDVRKGYSDLELLSSLVLQRLERGDKITLKIKGFTSPRAKTKYNDNLARRRTSALRNHFNTFNGGVLVSYIRSGALRIEELPIGEATAPSGISDVISDELGSIYSVGASKERRAEVVAIEYR